MYPAAVLMPCRAAAQLGNCCLPAGQVPGGNQGTDLGPQRPCVDQQAGEGFSKPWVHPSWAVAVHGCTLLVL